VATSALDVRGTAMPPRLPAAGVPAEPVLRRAPAPVVAIGAIGLLQAVAVVAAALAGLGAALTAVHRPPGAFVGIVLVALAAWVVLCATSAATVLDGTGRRLFTALAAVEFPAAALLLVAGLVVPLPTGATGGVPVPVVALLALALPAGKLLLAGAPATDRWLVQGPRPRERRVDPVAAHRGLCVGTLLVIGAGLGALALLCPAAPGSAPSSTVSVQH
jgi:hypothetical protein